MNEPRTWDITGIREILEHDDAEALNAALHQGLDPQSWFDADAEQALLAVAILEDSRRCVGLLLELQGDWALDAPFDEDLESPLAIAVERGSDEVLLAFVRGNAVARYSVDWLRAAAIGLAARRGCGESTLVFLEALASRPEGLAHLLHPTDLKALRKRASTCGKEATGLGDRWRKMTEILGRASGQVDAIVEELGQLALGGHVGRVRQLIGQLPPNARSGAAGLVLVYATARKDWALAEELLEIGADCTARDPYGTTALMNAARWGNLSFIRKLLDRGADLQAREKGPRGKTAIEMAHSPMIRRYLEKLAARAN